MKKLYFAVVVVLLLSSFSFGEVVGDTESMAPGDVNIFVKTRHIGRLLKSANYIVYHIMDEENRNQFLAEKDSFRDKTGIDYLDEESLKKFGVDTSRAISFAMYDMDNSRDVMLVFIPVFNEPEFVLNFIETVKKTNAADGGQEISPVTTKYRGVSVTQIKKDAFVAAYGGYFIMASTDDILRKSIDVREDRNGSLILTAEYRDYISKDKNNYDLNAFITRKFIEQQYPASNGEGYGSREEGNLLPVQGKAADQEAFDRETLLKSIDYVAAGMGFDGNKFQLNGSVKLAGDNPYVDMLLGLLKTGENGKSLYVQSADSTIFLSLNYKYLDNLCRSGIPMCTEYNQSKEEMKKLAGIDFEKDILPYYSGVMNIFSIDSGASGGMGDLVVFLPVNDEKKIRELWGKFREVVKAKYSKQKKFGDERIGGKRGFWYIDETQMRFFVVYDKRGIYAGNSTGLMKAAIKSDTMSKAKNTGRLGRLLNDKTFFLVNIKKNNFIKNMLMMRAQGTPGLSTGLSLIGEVNLFCEKKDKLVSVDFDIEIKEGMKKTK